VVVMVVVAATAVIVVVLGLALVVTTVLMRKAVQHRCGCGCHTGARVPLINATHASAVHNPRRYTAAPCGAQHRFLNVPRLWVPPSLLLVHLLAALLK
jgi:hypothetical protein